MKNITIFVFLILAVLSGFGGVQTQNNFDKPTRLYVSEYILNDLTKEIPYEPEYWSDTPTNTHLDLEWYDGKDSHCEALLNWVGAGANNWNYRWPAATWPDLLSGIVYDSLNPRFGTNTTVPPTIKWEYCKIKVGENLPYSTLSKDREAHAKIRLQTGGKATRSRRNLFVFSGSATEIPPRDWVLVPYGMPAVSAPRAIPFEQISVAGKFLGNDGNLYLALPDDTDMEITPTVTGVDFYTFGVGAQKHKLHILANGYPLAEDRIRPQAYYCVGQKIDFQGVLTPDVPGLDYTSPIWNYTADYVNNHYTGSAGCEIYNIAPIPAMSNPTKAWFYNKQTQDATANLGLYCKFNNGQSVYLVRQGLFNVFTPSISFIPSGGFTVNVRHGTGIGFAAVLFGVGETDGTGSLIAQANINSIPKFPGQAIATQLINRQASIDGIPFGTGGTNALDNTEIYPGSEASLTNDVTNPHSNLLGRVAVIDQPGIPITVASWASGNDQFETYFRFKPDGNSENIYVTLGRADWSWHGNVLYTGGVPYNSWLLSNWTISGAGTSGPTFNQVNDFPLWAAIYSNFP